MQAIAVPSSIWIPWKSARSTLPTMSHWYRSQVAANLLQDDHFSFPRAILTRRWWHIELDSEQKGHSKWMLKWQLLIAVFSNWFIPILNTMYYNNNNTPFSASITTWQFHRTKKCRNLSMFLKDEKHVGPMIPLMFQIAWAPCQCHLATVHRGAQDWHNIMALI